MSEKSSGAAVHAVGRIVAKPGQETRLLSALSEVVAETRKEPGNLHFDLYRGSTEPALFIIEESWRDAEALQSHVTTPHVKAFFARAETLAQAPLELTLIDPVESE